jgi:hypothetical protein
MTARSTTILTAVLAALVLDPRSAVAQLVPESQPALAAQPSPPASTTAPAPPPAPSSATTPAPPPAPPTATPTSAPAAQAKPSWLEVHADLQNLFHFRNDSDFDRTPPFYDDNGQTVGAFATVFRPSVLFRITRHLRIYYEVELGLNYWSKQNPDQQAAVASDVFVMKHREIYGEGELWNERLGFKVGYQYLRDPTGLFLGHWIGAAQAWLAGPRGRIGLFVGEVPDQTYEGINVLENNFKRDIFVFGLTGAARPRSWLRVDAGISALVDTHLVGQMRWLLCPSLHLEMERGPLWAYLDAALQAGQLEGRTLGGGAQTHLAWAAQAGARLTLRRLEIVGNVLALSADDAYDANGSNHAFFYSSKSRSSTLMLTEDEIRNWYDALDRRMGAYDAGFFMHRAGMMVADVKATWDAHRHFRPALVLGAATVLKPANALDSTFVGFEADLVLSFPATSYLSAQLAGGVLVPGKAGAALINGITRDATDTIAMVEASLLLHY